MPALQPIVINGFEIQVKDPGYQTKLRLRGAVRDCDPFDYPLISLAGLGLCLTDKTAPKRSHGEQLVDYGDRVRAWVFHEAAVAGRQLKPEEFYLEELFVLADRLVAELMRSMTPTTAQQDAARKNSPTPGTGYSSELQQPGTSESQPTAG